MKMLTAIFGLIMILGSSYFWADAMVHLNKLPRWLNFVLAIFFLIGGIIVANLP